MKFLNIILLFLLLTACDKDRKFEKTLWLNQSDVRQYPYRNNMCEDLVKNHKLRGLSYKQLVNLIGEPEKTIIDEPNSIYYEILTEYGSDIDPIKTKTLIFKLNSDSTILDFKIEEWKK